MTMTSAFLLVLAQGRPELARYRPGAGPMWHRGGGRRTDVTSRRPAMRHAGPAGRGGRCRPLSFAVGGCRSIQAAMKPVTKQLRASTPIMARAFGDPAKTVLARL